MYNYTNIPNYNPIYVFRWNDLIYVLLGLTTIQAFSMYRVCLNAVIYYYVGIVWPF